MPFFHSTPKLPRHPRIGRARPPLTIEPLESRVLLTAVPPAYNFASLAPFNLPVTGGQPEGLIIDSTTGDLYGTTSAGGPHSAGTIFKINAGASNILTLAAFTGPNGNEPVGNLVFDHATNTLYGTTIHGGAFDDGTIFSLNVTTNTITTLFSFNGQNGIYPLAGLVADASGNLFGTTFGSVGATHPKSTVFELALTGTSPTFSVLATFAQGSYPDSTLVVDNSGNVFGTTSRGGTNGVGSIFEVVANSGTVSTLTSFTGINGARPQGTLLFDSNSGIFTGTTLTGGKFGAGTLFQFSAGNITTLVNFDGTHGGHPLGNIIPNGSGGFYGTTAIGGANGTGTIYDVVVGTTSTITTLFTFRGARTGLNPSGPLVMNAAGDFFGTTFLGGPTSPITGTQNSGTVFELVPAAEVPSPARLVFILSKPGNAIAGHPLPNTLTVQIQDVFGNLLTNNNETVSLAVDTPAGASVSQATAVNGVATFTNIVVDTAGTHTLVATDGTRSSLPSKSFKISADATTPQLVVTQPPTTSNTGSSLTLVSIVQVQDQFGNTIPSYHSKISWSLTTGPTGTLLSGTTSLVAVGGKATFNNLTLTWPESATSGSFTFAITGVNLATISPMFTLTRLS